MPTNMPDMDMLALAGMTKAGLRDIDSTSVGSSPHADKINIRAMAGMDGSSSPAHSVRGLARGPARGPATPSLLDSFDFVDKPTSRPMGQVSMEGDALPDRPIDLAQIPESLGDNVDSMLAYVANDPTPPPIPHDSPNIEASATPKVPELTPDMDFDLFQFTILKEIIAKLDNSIASVETCLDDLKSRRDHINNLIAGE